MRRLILLLCLLTVLAAPSAAPGAAEKPRMLAVRVSAPDAVLSLTALEAVSRACALLGSGDAANAAAALEAAIPGALHPALKGDLQAARERLAGVSPASSAPPAVPGDPFFVLFSGANGAVDGGWLGLPAAESAPWLATLLEDPSRLRPDLPAGAAGVEGDTGALPGVLRVDLAAATRVDALSAWVSPPSGAGWAVVFSNLVAAYCREHVARVAEAVMPETWAGQVDPRALEWLVAVHRLAHGLGPVAARESKKTEDEAKSTDDRALVAVPAESQGPGYVLEEIKAESLAVVSGLRLAAEENKDFPLSAGQIAATWVAFLMDRAFRGSPETAQPFRFLFQRMVAREGLNFDLRLRRIVPDPVRIRTVLQELLQRVISIQGRNKPDAAAKFLQERGASNGEAAFFSRLVPQGIAGFILEPAAPPADGGG